MELTELKDRICQAFKGTTEELEELLYVFETDESVFPFNEYELLLTSMMSSNGLTYNDYKKIRAEYLSKNPNLWLFEISGPRTFGEKYGQTILQTMFPELKSPNVKLDNNYNGQYDLWLDGIRIEVKASRMVDKDSHEPLYKKALSFGTEKNFLMNFQQLKPQCCDVFVWLAVYRDCTTFWVMNSREVQEHEDYSRGQHRGNIGNEGQLHIKPRNIKTFDKYVVDSNRIVEAIRDAAKR